MRSLMYTLAVLFWLSLLAVLAGGFIVAVATLVGWLVNHG